MPLKRVSILLSGSDDESEMESSWEIESNLYTYTNTSVFFIIILTLPLPCPYLSTIQHSFFHSYRKLLEFKMQGLRGGRPSYYCRLPNTSGLGWKLPPTSLYSNRTHTHTYTEQLSPLICRLHTIPTPYHAHKKKKNFFFIRTFVLCNAPHGVSPGCTGTGHRVDVRGSAPPHPLRSRDLRSVISQWWMVLVAEYKLIPGFCAI